MAVRNSSQYREGLLDGRSVWFRGIEVADVTKHPAFARKVDAIADLFEAADCPIASSRVSSPDAGGECRPSFVMPRTADELRDRRLWSTWIAQSTFGLMGRSPDYLQTALMSFAASSEFFEANNPSFSTHVRNLYCRAALGDLFLARATVGPAGNRGKAFCQYEDPFVNLRVVRETDSGILVRGAKMISTNAAIADELLVFPISGFQDGDDDYALSFMTPISTPGLKIVCRDAYDDGSRELSDFPISTRFEEIDSLCVFDDVHLPWERVFLYRNVPLANTMYGTTCSRNFTGYQTLIRSCVKTDFYVAVAICCAEISGCYRHMHVREMLGELISYSDVMHGLLSLAEMNSYTNKWGLYCPSAHPAQSARVLFHRYAARMVEVIQTIAAGTLFALPTTKDLDSRIGSIIERTFQCEWPGWSARKRLRLFKLAWELVADGFGQRQTIYEKYHAGDPFRIAAAHFEQQDKRGSYHLIDKALGMLSSEVEPEASVS